MATSCVNTAEAAVWNDRREAYTCSSSHQGGSMEPPDGYVTPPKKSNPNKFLYSEPEAFDQLHIFAFRVRFLWTPALSWICICVNTSEECVDSTTKDFCSGMCFLNVLLCGLKMSKGVWLNEKSQKMTTQVSQRVLLLLGVMSFSPSTGIIKSLLPKHLGSCCWYCFLKGVL